MAETYADQFFKNRFATIATSMSYGKTNDASVIHKLASYLRDFADNRTDNGKSTTDDHLKQEAIKWLKM